MLLNNPFFYFIFGQFVFIGAGALLINDFNSIYWLLVGVSAFSLGMFFSYYSFWFKSPSFDSVKANKKDKVVLPVILLLLFFIFFKYGLPIFSDDPTKSRLEQRNYVYALSIIQYLLPIFLALSYINGKVKNKLYGFYAAVIIAMLVSYVLAVRYIFAEVLVFIVIFQIISHNGKIPIIKILLYGLFFLLFFVVVQAVRVGDFSLGIALDKLVTRLFIVNYDIFKLSLAEIEIPSITYINSLNKIIGESSYNLGFLLYDTLGKKQAVQGYAPPSIIGESYINFGVSIIAATVIVVKGFIYFGLIGIMRFLLVSKNSIKIFDAFVFMELLRLYAHTFIGSLFSILIFFIFLSALTTKVKVANIK